MQTSTLALLLLAAPLASAQQPLAPPELEPGILAGFDGAAFGDTVAIDGDRALITAPVTFFGTSLSGSAWIYRWSGAGWEVESHLDAPGGAPYQDFGRAGDLSGDVAVIGVRYMDTVSGNNSGGAVVFERVGGAWLRTDELLPPPGSDGALYGQGIAVEGDLAVMHSDDAEDPFLVYERQPGGGWSLVDQILLDDVPNTELSSGVARIQGQTLFLPAPYKYLSGPFDGEIQVWERTGATWSLDQKIRATTPIAGAYLGRAFDVDGDRLVAASPFVQQPTGELGTVVTFDRVGGQWVQTDAFDSGVVGVQLLWGDEVALAGDLLLVAAPNVVASDPLGAPLVELYRRDGAGWTLVRVEVDPAGPPGPVLPGSGVYGTYFGGALALDGERAIVGAPYDDGAFQDAGEAWAYDVGALAIDVAAVSLATGGTQGLALEAGFGEAGQIHLVLGSFAGTAPGVPLGGVTLPLAIDPYLLYALANPGAPPIVGGLGVLDGDGAASAQVVVPAGLSPSLAGATAHHAYVVLDAATLAVRAASEAEALALVP